MTSLRGAPSADELSLMLRGFLIRLMALDSQLEDNRGELHERTKYRADCQARSHLQSCLRRTTILSRARISPPME